jgi:hypothetical protein
MKHDDMAKDKPMIKKIAGQEVKAHEKRMHGKKMAKGGVTSESMVKAGRNQARIANQKSG